MAIIMIASLGACTEGTTTVTESEIVLSDGDSTTTGTDNTESKNESDSSDKGSSDKQQDADSDKNNTDSGEFNPYEGIEKYKGKTVKFATWWTLTKYEQKALEDFEKKYNINIDTETYTYEAYATKITSQISSGQSPDLCAMHGHNYLTFIQNNLLQPISAGKFDIKNDKKLDLSTMKALSWKGKMYGINLANNMTYGRYVIYYNKAMFENAGLKSPYKLWKEGKWNWDTFADYAKKMTTRKGNKTIYGYTGLDTIIAGWLLTNGCDFITSDGNKITNAVTSKKVQETLTFISELRDNGYWCPDDSDGAFLNGEAAMMGEGTWMVEESCQPKVEYGIAPLPCPKGAKEVISHESTLWCIATGAKEPIAASYFIRYWLDFDNHNLKKSIPNKEAREVFEYMSDTSKNRKTSIARSVAGYYESSQYWLLLHISRSPVNDIPVDLKKMSSTMDGIIKKIQAK